VSALGTTGAAAPVARDADRLVVAVAFVTVTLLLGAFVLVPLGAILAQSLHTPEGLGFGNYTRYFGSPKFGRILGNTLTVAATTTAITVVLAYGFAFAMRRTCMRGKAVFGAVMLLPLLAPSLVQALGLLFLFGRNGIVNRTLDLGLDPYGFWGIVIADVFYSLPHAYLILSAALAAADARLYEAARTLGASRARMFRTITLPSTRYGLLSASFVVFTIVITDFGNPMVIGGDYGVLATEIYNQVSGQANLAMGAVIGVVLLAPAAVAVIAERWIVGASQATITAQARPLDLHPEPLRDRLALAYCSAVGGALVLVIAVVVVASFVTLWPYNMHMSLRHYRFEVQQGIAPLWTSIGMSLAAAAIGVVVTVAAACTARRVPPTLARGLYFLSILPAAIPGMVLGLGYVLIFNAPGNPLEVLYGTVTILALCTVYHYHAQGYLVAATGLGQVSKVFDEAATSLGAGVLRTLRTVTLPMVAPAIASIGVFFFMRSMVTLSALVFIVTPATQVAAVSVLLLDDSGNQNQAAAYSVCIMAVVLAALATYHLLLRVARRVQRRAAVA